MTFPLIVLDASAALAIVFADEDGEEVSRLVQDIAANNGQIYVPELFWYEVANALRSAVLSTRISIREAEKAVRHFAALPIVSYGAGDSIAEVLSLAVRHNLGVYDASYLDLAVRYDAKLKTFDSHLLGLARVYPDTIL